MDLNPIVDSGIKILHFICRAMQSLGKWNGRLQKETVVH
ncbi:hypothetical protein LINPERPRIM_LOCUS40167, partial [Linum perenne]